LKGSLPW
jgi:hypothetical protein